MERTPQTTAEKISKKLISLFGVELHCSIKQSLGIGGYLNSNVKSIKMSDPQSHEPHSKGLVDTRG